MDDRFGRKAIFNTNQKKIRCQVVKTLSAEGKYKIKPLCRLLGISSQGYYKHTDKEEERDVLISSIILYCKFIRNPENLPQSGCRELMSLCREHFGKKFSIGRDLFYHVLRANNMMLRKRRYRPRTTDSRHHYHIYPDLLNTVPKLSVTSSGQLMVADITYVYCKEGFAYLSLITDAYNRCILGYSMSRTLDTDGPLTALTAAMSFYQKHSINTKGLIHHSDRGCQYASERYVTFLKENGISISMTQDGDPLHNALAERMNNTLKNEWIFNNGVLSFEQAQTAVARAIEMYNSARPHQALQMRTPLHLVKTCHKNPLT